MRLGYDKTITLAWGVLGGRFSFVENQGVEFRIRQGYFNQPYIEEVISIPAPAEIQLHAKGDSQTQIPASSYREVAGWKISLPKFEAHTGSWAEERYSSGAFRQRDPLVDGKKSGLARYWHENGVLYGEIPWRNDQKHGCFKLYRSDGSLEQALSYRDGKPHGFFSWYDPSGKLFARELYQDGGQLRLDQATLEKLYHLRGCP